MLEVKNSLQKLIWKVHLPLLEFPDSLMLPTKISKSKFKSLNDAMLTTVHFNFAFCTDDENTCKLFLNTFLR